MPVSVPEQSSDVDDLDGVGSRRRQSLIHFLVEAALGLFLGVSSSTGVDAPDPANRVRSK